MSLRLTLCRHVAVRGNGRGAQLLALALRVPLAGIAVAFGSWWLVVLLAVVVAALGLLLGALTPQTYIGDPEFLHAAVRHVRAGNCGGADRRVVG